MDHLVTPRLTLRPVGPQDRDAVVEGLNHRDVTRWLAVVPYPYGTGDFRYFLDEVARPGSTWGIEEAGSFLGVIGLETGALGYWLQPLAHGRGIATEAAGAVLTAHFAAGGGPVVAGYFEGNARSARVLAKLGFAETARDTKFCRALDEELPHVTLGLTVQGFELSAFNLARISRG